MTCELPAGGLVRQELHILAGSEAFRESPRLVQLLEHLVEETLAGRGHQLKAYSIALDVFGRDETFDPATDSIVRVQAARLRLALERHYALPGVGLGLTISLPKGSYTPQFTLAPASGTEAGPRTQDVIPPEAVPRTAHGLLAPLPLLRARWTASTGRQRAAAVTICVCLMVAVAAAWGTYRPFKPALPAINTIALFPFSITTGNEVSKAVARGVEGQIASILGNAGDFAVKLGPELGSHPSSRDIQDKAKDLGTLWAIHGRLVGTGTDAHLDVLLLDVLTGDLIWSKSFNAPSNTDRHALAVEILSEQRPHLFAAMRTAVEVHKPGSKDRLDLFMLANWAWGARHSSLGWEQERVALARMATSREPAFGPAWGVLADKLAFLAKVDANWRTPALEAEAKAAAFKAVTLAPHHSETTFNVAMHHFNAGNVDEARAYYRRTLDQNKGHPVAALMLMSLDAVCEPREETLTRLKDFDNRLPPNSPIGWVSQFLILQQLVMAGKWEDAVSAGRKSIREFSNPVAVLWLALALVQAGRPTEAIGIVQQERLHWPSLNVQHYVTYGLFPRCDGQPSSLLRSQFEDLSRTLHSG